MALTKRSGTSLASAHKSYATTLAPVWGSFDQLIKEIQTTSQNNFSQQVPVPGVDGLYQVTISTYGTSFENAVGYAMLYFNKDGLAVGFSDYWNFDKHSQNDRPGSGEAKTTFGSYIPGRAFLVLYGQTPPDNLIPKN